MGLLEKPYKVENGQLIVKSIVLVHDLAQVIRPFKNRPNTIRTRTELVNTVNDFFLSRNMGVRCEANSSLEDTVKLNFFETGDEA